MKHTTSFLKATIKTEPLTGAWGERGGVGKGETERPSWSLGFLSAFDYAKTPNLPLSPHA